MFAPLNPIVVRRTRQRCQVGTVMGMIKRRVGRAVAGRSDAARARDAMLKVITHNLMLLVGGLAGVFYGAGQFPSAFLVTPCRTLINDICRWSAVRNKLSTEQWERIRFSSRDASARSRFCDVMP
jgi:hypothetical protein